MRNLDEVLDVVAQILARCTAMGMVSLLIWWGVLELFGDLAYRIHSRIAPMPRQQFNVIHYVGILMTKAAISVLFFFPFVAIRLVVGRRKNQL